MKHWVAAVLIAALTSVGGALAQTQGSQAVIRTGPIAPEDYTPVQPDGYQWCDEGETPRPGYKCWEVMGATASLPVFTTTAVAGASSVEYVVHPFLPWPPPRPAHFANLGNQVSAKGTLGDVAGRLERRLAQRGYDRLLYFSADGGFAVATQVERFEADGRATSRARFVTTKVGGLASLTEYLRRLVYGESGRFRIFVFVVTNKPFVPAPYDVTQTDVERWRRTGSPILPPEIARMKAPRGTVARVLIYELQGGSGSTETFSAQAGPVPERAHLTWLGFTH